jgi:hypothetical protein
MTRHINILIVMGLILAQTAMADQIILKNGDRITGTLIKSDGKSLTMKSEFVGTFSAPLDAVDQISAEQPLYIVLKDGQTVVGTVTTSGGALAVQTKDTGTLSVVRDSIVSVRSKEEQAAFELAQDRLRNPSLADLWAGALDSGISLSKGNADTVTYSLGMNATRTTPRDKISVYVTSLYARNNTTGESLTTANAKRGGARYDINLSKRIFVFGLGELESDEFQDLDLRLVLGGGAGWHAYKSERALFDVFGGGSLDKEYFTGSLRRTSGEALIGQEFAYRFSGRTWFKEKAVYYPNLSESGEYRFLFDASAQTALKTWLGWHVTFSNRYLSNPVFGKKSNDMLLTTGLRLTFGRE